MFKIIEGHWEWHCSVDHLWLSIDISWT